MRELRKCVSDICEKGKMPKGFGNQQCKVLIDIYNELCNETRVFLRDKQVYCFLKNRFHFPCKDEGGNLVVVWRKDLIRVVR